MARIIDIASYLPEKVLENDELALRFKNWDAEKILNKTGISTRHIANKEETASEMAIKAAQNLLSKNECKKNEIDMIFLITQSQDQCIPSTSFSIHKNLSLSENCGCFDINQGCTGYIYGLSIARSLINTKQANNILMITSDTYSKFINPEDSSLATLFGDGATATLIQSDEDSEIEGIGKSFFGTDSTKKDFLICDYLGLKTPIKQQKYLNMDGPGILNFTLNTIPKSLFRYLEDNKSIIDDYDHVVFHQANKFILEKLYKKIGALNNGIISLKNTGNTVSSSIPLVLEELIKVKNKKRSHILLAGFGVGLSWGFTNIVL